MFSMWVVLVKIFRTVIKIGFTTESGKYRNMLMVLI